MTWLRDLLDRLPGGHRPPTGPLTTDEENRAEAMRQKTLVDDERIDQGPEEESDSSRPERTPTDRSL